MSHFVRLDRLTSKIESALATSTGNYLLADGRRCIDLLPIDEFPATRTSCSKNEPQTPQHDRRRKIEQTVVDPNGPQKATYNVHNDYSESDENPLADGDASETCCAVSSLSPSGLGQIRFPLPTGAAVILKIGSTEIASIWNAEPTPVGPGNIEPFGAPLHRWLAATPAPHERCAEATRTTDRYSKPEYCWVVGC